MACQPPGPVCADDGGSPLSVHNQSGDLTSRHLGDIVFRHKGLDGPLRPTLAVQIGATGVPMAGQLDSYTAAAERKRARDRRPVLRAAQESMQEDNRRRLGHWFQHAIAPWFRSRT